MFLYILCYNASSGSKLQLQPKRIKCILNSQSKQLLQIPSIHHHRSSLHPAPVMLKIELCCKRHQGQSLLALPMLVGMELVNEYSCVILSDIYAHNANLLVSIYLYKRCMISHCYWVSTVRLFVNIITLRYQQHDKR